MDTPKLAQAVVADRTCRPNTFHTENYLIEIAIEVDEMHVLYFEKDNNYTSRCFFTANSLLLHPLGIGTYPLVHLLSVSALLYFCFLIKMSPNSFNFFQINRLILSVILLENIFTL